MTVDLPPLWGHNGGVQALKIRNVPDDIVERIRQNATENGRSLESELRAILAEACGLHVSDYPSAEDWQRAGFDSVDELVSGRLYLIAFEEKLYRLGVYRRLEADSVNAWYCVADEAIDAAGHERVWTKLIGQPGDVLRSESPGAALREARNWLRAVSRVRSPEAEQLRIKVDAIKERLRKKAEAVAGNDEHVNVELRYSPSASVANCAVRWTKASGEQRALTSSGTLQDVQTNIAYLITEQAKETKRKRARR